MKMVWKPKENQTGVKARAAEKRAGIGSSVQGDYDQKNRSKKKKDTGHTAGANSTRGKSFQRMAGDRGGRRGRLAIPIYRQ